MLLRLDKYLADMSIGTRTEVRALIKQGRISVDGVCERKPERKVDTQLHQVALDGKPVGYARYEYWMLNKPAGAISATTDSSQATVLDLLPQAQRKDLFPVGRLDKDTTGLLIITNDGQLAHRLLAPNKHVDKIYLATLRDPLGPQDAQAFAEGLDIGDDTPTLPALLEQPDPANPRLAQVTLHEGRYHQVKRMFEAVGNKVVHLQRIHMGPISLDPSLQEGQSRPLSDEEVRMLQAFKPCG